MPEMLPDSLPATYGGATFTHRTATHAEDVSAGQLWRTTGAVDEFSRLREVLLAVPPDTLAHIPDPDAALMLGQPDLPAMRRQLHQLATAYAAEGVAVHLHNEPTAPPNVVFMRDLVFCTGEGAAVGRPASPVRAAEAAVAQRALAQASVPLLGVPRAGATFEGADALWLDQHTLLVGLGTRTNRAALAWLRGLVGPEVQIVPVPLPRGTQHLLGILVLVDQRLAIVDQARLPYVLRRLLQDRGYTLIEVPETLELRAGRGMNVVVTAPRRVVMPAHCPGIEAQLRHAGIHTRAVDVSAFLVAGGAMGCMTAILRRDHPRNSHP
jgi:N-dimethylarginine dimethylaminohydrolase